MLGEAGDNRGAALVFRGENEGFLSDISSCVGGFYSPRVAEAMVLRTGLLWALDNLLDTESMYTDAQEVYFAIKSFEDDWIEFGSIIF
ncbi:hypothetical protein GOBAR_AA07045 [Gossypium barbadense]|uniref:RNase H type-1 domain-containing protein n=1 Tax=Gossypium barbadense TaxID=3634 RepID=A0A2P5YDC2_GOSBA|nr:hypothetical protein GOBAR_AA07045 [Gossypium barbadense]